MTLRLIDQNNKLTLDRYFTFQYPDLDPYQDPCPQILLRTP